jgi:hypothetical protein
MNLKVVIALFLALVIQLSQAQSFGVTSSSPAPCGDGAHPMSCCEGSRSCPCAGQGESGQKPAPLIPGVIELKPLVSQVSETICPSPVFLPRTDATVHTASPFEFRTGYAGVPLSVAFCTFVI